jgi:hypothetical protein
VQVDQAGKVLHFVGEGPDVCIDGGSGPAFDVRSTFRNSPVTIRNFRLQGGAGVWAQVPTAESEIRFRQITDVALDLDGGRHRIERVDTDGTVNGGVDLAFGARAEIRRSSFTDLAVWGMLIDGEAYLENTLVARAGGGIVVGADGALTLHHCTLVSINGDAVDHSAGGSLSVTHSLYWNNAGADIAGVSMDCSEVDWSLVCDSACIGVSNNLCADPLFVNPASDYRLSVGSPVADHGPHPAGDTGLPCFDIEGGPRARDFDGDGLAQRDPGAYETSNTTLVPGAVESIRWIDPDTMEWEIEPAAIEYHIYRDLVTSLAYDAFGTCRDDLDLDRTDTQLFDPEVPGADEAWYYLVTSEGNGGEEGSLGLATCTERSNFTPCP